MLEKTRLRHEAHARREALPGRSEKSAVIDARIRALPEYASARTIAVFVGVGSEVETLPLIRHALAAGKRVAVPWVDGPELRLFSLESEEDLAPAPFGLLEPDRDLRKRPERDIAPTAVDLYVIPGLAFDRSGGRLGHGRGFYDRLLRRAGPTPSFTAVAFGCQIFPAVPMTSEDVRMHRLVTEDEVVEV